MGTLTDDAVVTGCRVYVRAQERREQLNEVLSLRRVFELSNQQQQLDQYFSDRF